MLRYLRNDEVTQAVGAAAKKVLAANWHQPWGTRIPVTVEGRALVARIERHFHEPGGPLKPWGEHTGCSMLIEEDDPLLDTQPAVPHPQFRFGKLSLRRLEGVDERLVRVMHRALAITTMDFTVVCGRRTMAEQAACVANGSSQTLNSRHLTGHAVDIAPWIGGAISWQWGHFHILTPFVTQAAKDLAVPIEWGGNWKPPHRKDGPHWQIPWGQ